MAYRSRTRTQRQGGVLSVFLRFIAGGILAVVLFYVSWLGTTFVRSYVTPAKTEAESTQSTSNTSAPASQNSGSTANSTVAPAPAIASPNTVTIDGNVIDVDVSSTTAEIDQGLQYRQTLGSNQGMIFLFTSPAIYRFWMPNMSFPLDMIWIGANMQIVDITHDAPPLPDPTKPVWFTPKTPAQYVLEVNSGYADEHNIQIGDTVTFSLSNS